MDAGASDEALPLIQPFVSTLRSRSVALSYHVWAGSHDDAYWAAHVGDYLTFYGAAWPKTYGALPAAH